MSDSTDPTLQDQREVNAASRRRRTILIGAVTAVVVLGAAGLTAWAARGGDKDGEAAATTDTTLTVALRLFPENLDIRSTAGAALDQTLIDNVFQPLVTSDPKGTIQPSVAKSWAVSPDALTYTFTLLPDQRFSNGDPLTAKDVAWSIGEVTAKQYKDYQKLASVESVTAPDDQTVVIKVKQPDPTLLYNLSGRVGLVLDRKATNDPKSTAIGSGPFTVASFKPGATLTLARDPGYRGEKAQVGSVVFKLFSDTNAVVNAVQGGTVDVAGIDPNLVPQVRSNAKYDLVTGFASDKYVLAFNNAAKPFTDIRVRQAIRTAIDHDALVKAAGGGKTLFGPIVDSDPGFEDLSKLYPHDVAKAKQLLADAGYPNGLDLTVELASLYGNTITDLLTSQLATAGIRLTVKSVEFAAWLKDVYTNHDFQLSIVDHAEARDFGNWANPKYYFGYNNAQVQDLFKQATTATSEAGYTSLLQQAARIVAQDAAADWLYNPTLITAVRKGVTGVPTDSTNSRLNLTRAKA
ncbi:ABC transporter substrate-binding protein [Dactylosporangium vinaceum]|uniref:ABC transporter substrate-binding protein n=1 Tax=Dactylosporangium vinaceum TaxID=53362 RepID=A0ABV5M318_9ACTN|nr:ABC transporter substrate-binding protein [Dactylosporangium vinaceum]UAB99807.1 ABC transporter substrate-binding protein [Dactylosporangium vinaceum]